MCLNTSPLFDQSSDLATDLRDEKTRFKDAEAKFFRYIAELKDHESRQTDIRRLNEIHAAVEAVSKSVQMFRDEQRELFPEFYFVSQDHVTQFLSFGRGQPDRLNELMKCVFIPVPGPRIEREFRGAYEVGAVVVARYKGEQFSGGTIASVNSDGTYDVRNNDGDTQARMSTADIAVMSVRRVETGTNAEMEELIFEQTVRADCQVGTWLGATKDAIKVASQAALQLALDTNPRMASPNASFGECMKWMDQHIKDWVIIALQVEQHAAIHAALEAGGGSKLDDVLASTRNHMMQIVRNINRQDLRSIQRQKLEQMIVLTMNSLNITAHLIEEKATRTKIFGWESKLRYEFNPKSVEKLNVLCYEFSRPFRYESMGSGDRLVITPLTDRCFLSIVTCQRMGLFQASVGPAGTGKTETFKDYAKMFGLSTIITNCSDQMDPSAFRDILVGGAATGKTVVFDELNRVRALAMASFVALSQTLIRELRQSRLGATAEFRTVDLLGQRCKLNPQAFVLVSMNLGCSGRQPMPADFKEAFRYCQMAIPDFEAIVEIDLLRKGFERANELKTKLFMCLSLARNNLSRQDHYDFGLRMFKSLTKIAGLRKCANPKADEARVLFDCLESVSFMTRADREIFRELIQDLSPNLKASSPEAAESADESVKEACASLGLESSPRFISKVRETVAIKTTRHGVALLGPAGAGKSSVLKVALEQEAAVSVHRLPLSTLSADRMFGCFSSDGVWIDGLLPFLWRKIPQESETQHVILFDDDMDYIMMENLNTVLDDNCVLCLANNERLPLVKGHMRVVFEIADPGFKYCSPATVSRLGIIYIDETTVSYECLMRQWLANRSGGDATEFGRVFKERFPAVLELVQSSKLPRVAPFVLVNAVETLCRLLDALLSLHDDGAVVSPRGYERLFLFAAMWSFGGSVEPSSRPRFEDAWLKTFSAVYQMDKSDLRGGGGGAWSLSGESLFDFCVSPQDGALLKLGGEEFQKWSDRALPAAKPVEAAADAAMIVPNTRLTQLSFLSNLIISRGRHVMLAGGSVSTKTTSARWIMRCSGTADGVTLRANANTTVDDIHIDVSDAARECKASGSRVICFVDDLHIPSHDFEKFGSRTNIVQGDLVPVCMHLRNMIEYPRECYDLSSILSGKPGAPSIDDLSSVAFVAAMDSNSVVTPHLLRHFAVWACSPPGAVDLASIFEAVAAAALAPMPNAARALSGAMAAATIELCGAVAERIQPTPLQPYYKVGRRIRRAPLSLTHTARANDDRYPPSGGLERRRGRLRAHRRVWPHVAIR